MKFSGNLDNFLKLGIQRLLEYVLRTFFPSYDWPKYRRMSFGHFAGMASYFVTE
jgi:hypothetical protein